MKYAAVTLLIAALTTSAVLAQSPRRESPSSSWSEEQAPVEEVPVTPQPDAPIRLSVKAYWSADSKVFGLKASGVNVSHRDILGFFVRKAAVGGEGPGHGGWFGNWSDLERRSKALRPGEVYAMKRATGAFPAHLFPLQVYEVEAVLFTDGTLWCPLYYCPN